MREFLDILDVDGEGHTTYPSFVAVCALQLNASTADRSAGAREAEVAEAYALFTVDGEGPITMADLRRVARELKEEVDDRLLGDMLLEANGGRGTAAGVDRGEFEGVMRRAGVWR